MYQTPSRTKQEPFIGLILKVIIKDLAIPAGAELIRAVRAIAKKIK